MYVECEIPTKFLQNPQIATPKKLDFFFIVRSLTMGKVILILKYHFDNIWHQWMLVYYGW